MKTSIKTTGIVAALSIGILLSSCQKQNLGDVTTSSLNSNNGNSSSSTSDTSSTRTQPAPAPSSNVRLVNTSFDAGQASLYIANNKENSNPAKFGEFTDYAKANPSVPREPMRIMSQKDTLIISAQGFYTDNFYSVYLTGLRTDKTLSMIISHDDMTVPQPGNARVKFVNAAMGSGYLNVLYGNNILCWGQQYGVTSPTRELPAGNYNFGIATYGSKTPTITVAATLAPGKIYTIYTENTVVNGTITFEGKIAANN